MKLHSYQEYAVNYIQEHKESALILDMGLGKTVTTLTAIKELFNTQEIAKVLVIAPLRVARDTWTDEIHKWEHLKDLSYAVAVGNLKQRRQAVERNANITIINRENIPWLIDTYMWDFDMVVIDELSSFKNAKAKRFKALLKVRKHINRIVGLTGTPAPNGLEDLWAEFRLLDCGKRLGTYISHFRNAYMIPDKRRGHIVFNYLPRIGADKEIYNKISDMTVSMKAVDYLDMPKLDDLKTYVTMSDDEVHEYESLKKNFVMADDNNVTASNSAVLAGKLSQIANGAIYDDNNNIVKIHDHKLDALEDLIEQACGQPVLVAYWFKHDLTRIKERFDVREIKYREDLLDWNARKIPIAVIHPASAGHGLNLQKGGNILIWFGITWSLELYQQTNARLYRQGQESNYVVIQHILTKGTIDEQIMQALERKDLSQNCLINAVKANVK